MNEKQETRMAGRVILTLALLLGLAGFAAAAGRAEAQQGSTQQAGGTIPAPARVVDDEGGPVAITGERGSGLSAGMVPSGL